MRRRDVLAVGGSLLTAGCVGGLSGGSPTPPPTDTPTESPTPTPTPTPTEEQYPPKIVALHLVYEWEEFNDVYHHPAETATAGGDSTIAFQFKIWSHERQVEAFYQLTLYGPDDKEVTRRSDTLERLTQTSGYTTLETAATVPVTEEGNYTAVALVEDRISELVSEPRETTFYAAPT